MKKLIFLLPVMAAIMLSCKDKNDPEPELNPPIAEFEVSSDTVVLGDPIIFTDLSTTNPTSWLWFFGDGTSSTEQNPSHTYKELGVYSVLLKVSNEDGDDIEEKEDNIHVLEILTTNPKSSEFDLWVDENIMQVYDNPYTTGVSIAFIDNGQVSTYHYGETKRDNNTHANDNTLYQIASITKTFTGIATMRWLSQNTISLDTPVKNYLPEDVAQGLVRDNTEVTFRHLLSHISGLPREVKSLNFNSCTPYSDAAIDSTTIYNYLQNYNLLRKPGTLPPSGSDYYSNMGFGLLGIILERQNNKPLQEIFNELIFSEIGMSSTNLDDIESYENIAYPYGGYNSSGCEEMFEEVGSGYLGAGGINSNLTDMVKYAQFLLSAEANSELEIEIMRSFEKQYTSGQNEYCLPWLVYNGFYFHHGALAGMNSSFSLNKDNQRAVVFFTNYWVTDVDWEFMLHDFILPFITGPNPEGRKTMISLNTERR